MKSAFEEYIKEFSTTKNETYRNVGIECEIPVVKMDGMPPNLEIIQRMYTFLAKKGWELKRDPNGLIISAINNKETNNEQGAFLYDQITADAGYSTLEIVLSPQPNLYSLHTRLSKILTIIIPYFDSKGCKLLGYGIQPLVKPSRNLLMERERYLFFEKFSANHHIPQAQGSDSDLLNITASNQCHVEVSREEAITANNVLNAFSGLQIILQANSPIWAGKISSEYRACREIFWDFCFPGKLDQVGIPPKFDSLDQYVNFILDASPMLIQRDETLLQIVEEMTFGDFMKKKSPIQAQSISGEKVMIHSEISDLQMHNTFFWFNARLVPKYGTIESRMCCQQPPGETLVSVALTLGLIENLAAAASLMEQYHWKSWKKLRIDAIQETFDTNIEGESTFHLLAQLLDMAEQGLKKRNLGEEIFLMPLFQRLRDRQSPAEKAIQTFQEYGLSGLIESLSFTEMNLYRYNHSLSLINH